MKKILLILKKFFTKIKKRLNENCNNYHKELMDDDGCEFCGETPVCPSCYRCYNESCNAGCIFCRKLPEVEHCSHCGHEV